MKHENEDQESLFWRKCTKRVPGRPRPRREVKSNCQQNSSSMSFQENSSDVWKMENYEFCNVLDVKISKQDVYSTELRVIDSHRRLTSSSPLSTDSNSSSQSHNDYASGLNKIKDPVAVHSSRVSRLQQMTVGVNSEITVSKVAKFRLLLESNILDLKDLRQLSWSGIPKEVRSVSWRLLAGYLPARLERRQAVVEQKRLDYWNLVKQYFDTERDDTYQETYRQIHIDIPRMSPLIALFKQKTVQEMFERILFIWAIRHPASGYVQGINDLVTPFFVVFFQELLPEGGNIDTFEVNSLPKEHQDIIEADSFWCLSKFLDGIQDNYIFAQLGIQHKVQQLKELIQRIDITLHKHLQSNGVDYLQFSFRWMNNLLMREIPLGCSIRLWDTYLAESDSFATFHRYVCAAFLLHWKHELFLERDFQGLMLMLQKLPTQNWTEADIGVLVAKAYQLKFAFDDAPNHLQNNDKT